MSRIDELIVKLCPHGVPFRRLGDIANVVRGASPRPIQTFITEADDGVPWIKIGDVAVGGKYITNTAERVTPEGAAKSRRVYPGDFVLSNSMSFGRPYISKIEGCIHDGWLAISGFNDSFIPDFLYHLLRSAHVQAEFTRRAGAGAVQNLNADIVKAVTLPVPPGEVQREIVRVLDLFGTLEAELEVELEVRRRQHAFYWASLLTPRDGWRATTLSEVAEVFDGPHATPKKTGSGPWYLSISSLKNGRFDLTESAHLGVDEFPKWTRRVAPRSGDTMFSYETRIGQAAYWDRNEPAALGRRMGLLRPRAAVIDSRFLTLAYLGPQFQKLIEAKTIHGSTVDRIPIADMATWEIAIPALTEQHRIVDLLDKFDALVNDQSSGLPAEIAARRKQSEHYRNRLLTFKELAA